MLGTVKCKSVCDRVDVSDLAKCETMPVSCVSVVCAFVPFGQWNGTERWLCVIQNICKLLLKLREYPMLLAQNRTTVFIANVVVVVVTALATATAAHILLSNGIQGANK